MSRRERCNEMHQPTVGVSSVATASKNQAIPLQKKYISESRVWYLEKSAPGSGLPGSTRDVLRPSDYHHVGAGGTDQRA